MKKYVTIAVVVLCGSLIAWATWYEQTHAPTISMGTGTVVLHGPAGQQVSMAVEVADNEQERARGLMFRDTLAPGTGMLFVFAQPQPLGFWMKNTLLPLDILFFDAQGAFVSRTSMTPCTSDPCPTYPSAAPALLALEVLHNEPAVRAVGSGWTLQR